VLGNHIESDAMRNIKKPILFLIFVLMLCLYAYLFVEVVNPWVESMTKDAPVLVKAIAIFISVSPCMWIYKWYLGVSSKLN
jgi:hypothetical protein